MDSTDYQNLITEATSRPACDFCQANKVEWRYRATDFIASLELRYMSRGDWAACAKCSEYIESDKLDDLAFLISGLQASRNPEFNDLAGVDKDALHHIYYYWTRDLYRKFAANRTGERVKL